MTPEEFTIKCTELSKMAHEAEGNPTKPSGKLPEYYIGYTLLVKEYDQARIHAYGEFPAHLFAANKPLQTDDEFAYVKDTYQPKTKDTYVKFSNTVQRSLMNGFIEFRQEKDSDITKDFERFIREGIDTYDNFLIFCQAMVSDKVIDANGIVGTWPTYVTNEELEIIGYVNPYPVIYNVKQLVWFQNDEYIVETLEKTNVLYNGSQPQKVGRTYRYFGKEFVYEAVQVGKFVDHTFAISQEFEHLIGFTPARRMMGTPKIIQNKLFYDSTFNLAVPHLNDAALDSANLLIIKQKNVYPTRVVVREKCTYHGSDGSCEKGLITVFNGEDRPTTKTCTNCRGTGFDGIFGPMSELVVNRTPSGIDDERSTGVTAQNAMAYVSPPIETPKFLSEQIDKAIERAQDVLHLKSEPRGSGNITATEKDRDSKNTEAFIKPISDQIWFLIDYLISCIGIMRYGSANYELHKPTIITPTDFDLLSPSDYLEQIGNAKERKLPSIVIRDMIHNYFVSVSKDDAELSMRYDAVIKIDRLLGVTAEEIVVMLARNLIRPVDVVIHQSILYFIDMAIMENEKFLSLSDAEKKAIIEGLAAAAIPAPSEIELPAPAVF